MIRFAWMLRRKGVVQVSILHDVGFIKYSGGCVSL